MPYGVQRRKPTVIQTLLSYLAREVSYRARKIRSNWIRCFASSACLISGVYELVK